MSHLAIPVILAGGKGERFWPLSRAHRPKQFLRLDGSGRSLIRATAERLLPLTSGWDGLWVVTGAHLEQGIQQHLPEIPADNVLLEPQGRDTAPAVAWTVIEIIKRYGEDAVVGFFPADHWIEDRQAFENTFKAAVEVARSRQAIVTLGLKPTYAATGYGYIEQGQLLGRFGDFPAYQVNRFTEKPDRDTAETFIATNRYSWNSGIFIFRAGVMLSQLRQYVPELVAQLERDGVEAYPHLAKISLDYAVMENTDLATVLPVSFGWDDLGDWNAIERLLHPDKPNVELANHLGLDTKGAIVYASDGDELIVTIGLEDTIVVRDRDVTLIVKKDRSQDIKQVLKTLKQDPKYQHLL